VPHQAFGEVSIFNLAFQLKLCYNTSMNDNRKWGLSAQASNKILLASHNLEALKFTQLLISRYFLFEVRPLDRTYRPMGTDIEKKLQWILNIVESELFTIKTLLEKKEIVNFQADLLTITKDFLDTVGCNNLIVEEAYKLELDSLTAHIPSCQAHKSFVFSKLLSADYTKSVEEISDWFFNELDQYPIDYTTTSQHLTHELLKEKL
jgi:hypothetical protein